MGKAFGHREPLRCRGNPRALSAICSTPGTGATVPYPEGILLETDSLLEETRTRALLQGFSSAFRAAVFSFSGRFASQRAPFTFWRGPLTGLFQA